MRNAWSRKQYKTAAIFPLSDLAKVAGIQVCNDLWETLLTGSVSLVSFSGAIDINY